MSFISVEVINFILLTFTAITNHIFSVSSFLYIVFGMKRVVKVTLLMQIIEMEMNMMTRP